ncbi:hypothetical protein C8R48DRAFT_678926 [Suillus tomentosus]|nr:hypothetical protein C8R48DRAFT_678926 [Suillus tomentosus]
MAQRTYERDGGSIIGPRANRISDGSGDADPSLMKGISDGPANAQIGLSEVPGGPIIRTSSEPRVGMTGGPSVAPFHHATYMLHTSVTILGNTHKLSPPVAFAETKSTGSTILGDIRRVLGPSVALFDSTLMGGRVSS